MSMKDDLGRKTTLSRRGLLCGTAAAGLWALAGPGRSMAKSAPVAERVPGVQLYTVRASMEKDVVGTLQAIAAIGYREVETAGYGNYSAENFGRLLADLGLRSPSGHMNAQKLRADHRPQLEFAAEVGHRYVTIGSISKEDRNSLDGFKRWAEIFNRVGEACAALGMRFAYHNHDFEFVPIDGVVPYDILLNETDAGLVDFELDLFWVRKAGRDILPVLGMAPERFTMAHIKDMDEDGNMTDVGKGTMDFASILADPAATGIRHCFVEHDDTEEPFKSVAISRLALSSILD